MSKLIVWVAGFTKLGKAVKAAQSWLDGKKQYLAGLSMALPGLLTVIQKFQAGGIEYLSNVSSSPEYIALAGGVAIIANAAKGEKIRNENAQILSQLNTSEVTKSGENIVKPAATVDPTIKS